VASENDRAAVRRNGFGRPAVLRSVFIGGDLVLPSPPPTPKARTDQFGVLVNILGVIWCNIRFADRIEVVKPQGQARCRRGSFSYSYYPDDQCPHSGLTEPAAGEQCCCRRASIV
jgi:hypothetical protein